MKALKSIKKDDIVEFAAQQDRYLQGGAPGDYAPTEFSDSTMGPLKGHADEADAKLLEALGTANTAACANLNMTLGMYRDYRHALAGRLHLRAFGARALRHRAGYLSEGLWLHNSRSYDYA